MNKTRIRFVEIDEAKGKAKEVFDEIEKIRGKGKVDPLWKAYAVFPEVLEINWQRMQKILEGGEGVLSRKWKECMMVAVSELNQCEF